MAFCQQSSCLVWPFNKDIAYRKDIIDIRNSEIESKIYATFICLFGVQKWRNKEETMSCDDKEGALNVHNVGKGLTEICSFLHRQWSRNIVYNFLITYLTVHSRSVKLRTLYPRQRCVKLLQTRKYSIISFPVRGDFLNSLTTRLSFPIRNGTKWNMLVLKSSSKSSQRVKSIKKAPVG